MHITAFGDLFLSMFIDYAKITVQAGDGGDGCVAFRREKFEPKGGPAGGDGGKGGDIIAKADEHIHTLLDFRYNKFYHAPKGNNGGGAKKTGKSGDDIVIKLPVGTIIKDESTERIIADLTEHGQHTVIVKGGRGGKGNARFATSTNQAPRHFEHGEKGEQRNIILELKLIADVGLVGLPNAGKSTLLSRISAARPKIAEYPFTTLSPNLGIVKVDEFKSFVVADIPGLIEGAHQGKGLGHQFLRHIERTKILAMLLDATSEYIGNDYLTLLKELESYSKQLSHKKRLVVFTKADLLDEPKKDYGANLIRDAETILISSVKGTNIKEMLAKIWSLLEEES